MAATEEQEYPTTFREDTPKSIYLYLQIPDTVSGNTQSQRDLAAADVSTLSIAAYYEDETVIVAAANLTPVSTYIFTKRTGTTGPSSGWNVKFTAPATFFPHHTESSTAAGRRTIVEAIVTYTDGTSQPYRVIGHVLPRAGS